MSAVERVIVGLSAGEPAWVGLALAGLAYNKL